MSRLAKLVRAPENTWSFLRARVQFFIRRVKWPKDFVVKGKIGLSAGGTIEIGRGVIVVSDSKFNRAGINHPTQLVAASGARLSIGDDVGISGAVIYCEERICIGNHVRLGANCRIYDTDFHPIDHLERRSSVRAKTAPIDIGDDVWLGANVIVLKGVRIGARSVVAAGSVVSKDLPPDSLAAGVPAKVVRSIRG